jgi:hypothetical protein
MSRYTYAGAYRNPTKSFYVKQVGEHYEVWVRSPRNRDGSAPADHPHSRGLKFDEPDEAEDWIEGISEFFEKDYDNYLEENHYEIAQMERYEAFRNEY